MKTFVFMALAAQVFAVNGRFADQPCNSTVVGDRRIEHFESKMYGTEMTLRVWLPSGYSDAGNANWKYPTSVHVRRANFI
jgi:hypothetical protein